MNLIKKYQIILILLAPFLLFLMASTTQSCNPHRRGYTAKQVGASNSKRYHTRPASSKGMRKKNY